MSTRAAMDERDALEGARELRRLKRLATGVLAASAALLVVARLLQSRHPAFGFVAAFAEAATIGGIADWYAVVVLFRRPFGLPIPHSAIIPKNQNRIADKLGAFIETHFLGGPAVDAKLAGTDYALFVGQWLEDRARARYFSAFLLRLLPDLMAAVERSGFRAFLTRSVIAQIQSIDIAPLAAGVLRSFTADGGHQKLLNDLLGAFHQILNKPETIAALRARIREELPTLLNLYRADAFVLKRLVGATDSFFGEVLDNPQHPFRDEFDRFVHSFIESLSASREHAARIEDLKRDLLARPELSDLAQSMWRHVESFIAQSADDPSGPLRKHIENILVETGRQFGADPLLRQEFNQGVVRVLSSILESEKSSISRFISDQMKSWNIDQLVQLIEVNVGRDLQYIRFNGALIGGVAGLALHSAEMLLRL